MDNNNTLRQNLSSLPLTIIDPKEYEDVTDLIDGSVSNMRKTGVFLSLKRNMKDLENLLDDHDKVLITVDMKDLSFAIDTSPQESPIRIRKFRNEPTKFYTWNEVVSKLYEWNARGFKPKKSTKKVKCLNSLFEMVRIFKTKRGFILCNMVDVSYPESITDQYVVF